MNNWSGKGSARNLSLEVSLKGGDDNADAPGENVLTFLHIPSFFLHNLLLYYHFINPSSLHHHYLFCVITILMW